MVGMSFAPLAHVLARQGCVIIGRQHKLWCFRGSVAYHLAWQTKVNPGTS